MNYISKIYDFFFKEKNLKENKFNFKKDESIIINFPTFFAKNYYSCILLKDKNEIVKKFPKKDEVIKTISESLETQSTLNNLCFEIYNSQIDEKITYDYFKKDILNLVSKSDFENDNNDLFENFNSKMWFNFYDTAGANVYAIHYFTIPIDIQNARLVYNEEKIKELTEQVKDYKFFSTICGALIMFQDKPEIRSYCYSGCSSEDNFSGKQIFEKRTSNVLF